MIEIEGVDPKMIANNLEPYEPTHPGEFVQMAIDNEESGVTVAGLAEKFCMPFDELNDIIYCRRPMTYEVALMCEATLGIRARILIEQQNDYDRQMAKRNKSFMEKLSNLGKIAAAL